MNPSDLTTWLSTVAGVAIACWAAWRLNEAPRLGDWTIKTAVLCIFACTVLWVFDRLTGNSWRIDFPAMMLALAVYLWAGIWRHYRASRRARLQRGAAPAWSGPERRQ